MNNICHRILLGFVLLSFGFIISNAAPLWNNVPANIYIGETEGEGRSLMSLNLTEAGDYGCDITNIIATPGTAVGDEFEVRQINSQPNSIIKWELRSLQVSLPASTVYTVDIVCTNNNNQASLVGVVTVNVVNNEFLTDCEKTVVVDALNTAAGDQLMKVECLSAQGHDVDYNFTTTSTYFQIDHASGNVTAKIPMSLVDTTIPSVTLLVTCLDKSDYILRYCYVHFDMWNQNTPPDTSSLPASDTVSEALAPGSGLFTLVIEDPDNAQTHMWDFTCTPSAATSLFQFSGYEFQLKSTASFDYESLNSLYCDIYIEDPYMESGPFRYTLDITNVNEAPKCAKTMYYGTLTEETTPGAETITPGFVCNDEDGDPVTFSFSSANNSQQYYITPAGGVISYAVTYDRDVLGTLRVLEVYCTDDGHDTNEPLRDACYVTITNTDINDNAPAFTIENTIVVITDDTLLGTSLTTIAITDLDEGASGTFFCDPNTTSIYNNYIDVASDCSVHLIKKPDFSEDTHISYDVTATDQGSPTMSSIGSLEIVYQKTTTTTAVSTTKYEFWDEPGSIVAFVGALIGGLLLLGLLAFCCHRFCCGRGALFRRWLSECKIRPRKHRPRFPRRPNESYYGRNEEAAAAAWLLETHGRPATYQDDDNAATRPSKKSRLMEEQKEQALIRRRACCQAFDQSLDSLFHMSIYGSLSINHNRFRVMLDRTLDSTAKPLACQAKL